MMIPLSVWLLFSLTVVGLVESASQHQQNECSSFGCFLGGLRSLLSDGDVNLESSSDHKDNVTLTSNSTDVSPQDPSTDVAEGRGKKLKKALPFLLLLKMKYFIYGVITYVAIALIAKAALLKSTLALALSGVILLKRILTPPQVLTRAEVKVHETSHTVTGGYNGGGYAGGGYAGGGYAGDGHSGGGWDSYGPPLDQHRQYAHNTAHSTAYRGQKPVSGR